MSEDISEREQPRESQVEIVITQSFHQLLKVLQKHLPNHHNRMNKLNNDQRY